MPAAEWPTKTALAIPRASRTAMSSAAFVVQLRPQADPGEELFVGRVEHIASGEFVRFESAAQLLAFMANVDRATPR